VVDQENFPSELQVTAKEAHGYIMALEHKTYDVQGVQFHPESILTPDGAIILKNWLKK
jgi:anthranilate synthase component 2